MLPITLREYLDEKGRSPFQKWLRCLDVQALARIDTCLRRLASGNISNVKGVGDGVCELKIDFGPGYRVYFGRDGDWLVILLAGGTKKQQSRDIAKAQHMWAEYRRSKRGVT